MNISKLLDNIYIDKYNCIACDRELAKLNRYGLCKECLNHMPLNNNKICLKCGKPIYDEADYCMVCENGIRHFDRAYSPLIYKGYAEKLILNYKFYNKRYLSNYLTAFLIDEYLNRNINADLIIPVPQTNRADRERGFSQTALLATELGSRLKIDTALDVLIKIKETKHQAKLSGRERQSNVEGAFKTFGSVKGRKVLIIDDILTTGATMSEAAKAVLKGKPLSVTGLTLANAEYKPYME